MRFFGTFGPSCHDIKTLSSLLEKGMNGIRLNLSHTNLEDVKDWFWALDEVEKATGLSCERLMDLEGPEVRIGDLKKPLEIVENTTIQLGKDIEVPKAVFEVLEKGDLVSIDDGKLNFKALDEKGLLLALNDGVLTSRKSLCILNKSIPLPTLTKNDLHNIALMKEYHVDSVMLPFVRGKEDLIELSKALEEAGVKHARIYAKIENEYGINNIESFIDYCDEIVIARGDLGNALPLWQLPKIQKHLAAVCCSHHKDFMVVTQLLDSMVKNPVPTRAEVLDIYNAILDGASSLMVTAETAIGKYPELVMEYLVKTAKEGSY